MIHLSKVMHTFKNFFTVQTLTTKSFTIFKNGRKTNHQSISEYFPINQIKIII